MKNFSYIYLGEFLEVSNFIGLFGFLICNIAVNLF